MSTDERLEFQEWLGELEARCEGAKRCLELEWGSKMEGYRAAVRRGVGEALQKLEAAARDVTGANLTCLDAVRDVNDYADWLQWSLWDLPAIATALDASESELRRGVASCGMVYLSMRMVDDVIDRHHRYKGKEPTLLGRCQAHRRSSQSGDVVALLGGLLLCFEGLRALSPAPDESPGEQAAPGTGAADAHPDANTGDVDASVVNARGANPVGGNPAPARILSSLLTHVRNTLLGVLMEQSPPEEWGEGFYERLVELKNVQFWRVLYAAVDPHDKSRLLPFLQRYYAFAQKLNDLQDQADDEQRGQPNLVAIRRRLGGGEGVMRRVESELGHDARELEQLAQQLRGVERLVAETKLGESLAAARRFGVFNRHAPEPATLAPERPLGLQWYSDVSDIVSRLGSDALVERQCAVCGGDKRRQLFRKQGFSFYRCLDCTHVFVSPRVRSDILERLGRELDEADHATDLMEVQRYYSATICTLLRSRAPGSRLLDVGFGRGYLLELSRSFGFEAYGLESSPTLLLRLNERLGERLHSAGAGQSSLPWGCFDVILMSHVLEHMDDPREVLRQAYAALNPEGVLYVAVPDIDSVQFRVFGKNWGPVTPLAHAQYFNETSLQRLLADSGFHKPERLATVEVPGEVVPSWMRLMRQLGGTDTGELAMIAQRPYYEATR